ncbi:MAG: hypothetical protein A2277_01100 [Desulfobacterales bacterium RIFOXYA12_FULL_46_15]|nr:MAG: hypothetical protein A2277_01100 [Desulfobacterales bacterium RIFOXYA12_FULL_46_15]
MNSWTCNKDIKTRLEKKWNKGEFLAQCVSHTPFEPLRIPLKHPAADELIHQFDAARTWIEHMAGHAAKQDKKGFNIEWHQFNHRTLGKNRIPKAVIFRTLDDILFYLGKTGEANQYQVLFKKIIACCPELEGLLIEKPLDVLHHAEVWDKLLAIVSYLKNNPGPNIYLRQLEIPGVDTKFIENHKPWLVKLLTRILPGDSVNQQAQGPAAFETRFGFLSKPARIRFRCLDPDFTLMGLSDLEIPEHEFNNLPIKPDTIFIVENEITGLAFPPFPRALVVFGLGYSLSVLCNACWIKEKPVWYWGDIDTHGFAMIDQVRHYFPQTRSFLMDEATLLSHKALWGSEPSPVSRDLSLLTAEEAFVYDALRKNLHAPSLRLEQERISFTLVRRVLENIRNILQCKNFI